MEEAIINRHHQYRVQRRDNPSFSSTLLDVIYRSIDERDDKDATRKKRQSVDGCFRVDKQNVAGVRRNAATRNTGGAAAVRRKSAAAGDTDTASACSGYGLRFPPLEAETIYGFPSRPRPIRTTTTSIEDDDECKPKPKKQIETEKLHRHQSDDFKVKIEGKFVKITKSRAVKKIYGYLKQGKQPDSPGARLATFLISLFTTGNPKKSKISSISCTGIHDDIIHTNRKSKSADVSTSSSATSFSRSFLSKSCKTPPSSSTGMKRSVRFYPEKNTILDDYYHHRPKPLHGNRSDSPSIKFARKSFNEEIRRHFTEKNREIEESTRNLLKNYRKKVEFVFDSIKLNTENDEDYVVDGDDEDEAGSYASSDLFELDHLSAIGKDLCMEELPLYETTSIDANRAIANGLLIA